MIKYPFNNRQRQREPSTDSSRSEDLDHSFGPSSNEYVVTDVNHASYILSGLNSLRESAEFCDVILQVDGEKFSAHKIVLASFSPYFKTMFQSKYVESKQNTVHLKSIEADMMRQLLDFAYTSTIKITKSNCQNLLSAANLLQVMKVRDAACEFLESHMDTSNCLGIYCFAESHACTDLQQKAFDFALKNFWSVAQNEEFLELTADKLMELVRSDKLEVEKEELVFLAIKRWYNKKPDERSFDFHKVLETVRLPLIDPYFLHDCVESFSPITMSPECMKLIEEAKLFHLLPDRSVELLNNRTKQRNNANVVQVIVAVGGEDDKVVLRSVECYSPTSGMWYTLASLPFAISKHGLVASGKNNLYLAGGEYPDGKVSMAFWRYDPVLDIWQEMAPMTTPRSEFGLAVLDGYIYAVGGWEGSYRLDSMERYDPNSNTWTMVHKLKMAVTSAAVVAYDRMLYVAGGAVYEEGDGINCLLRYDPRTETWSELPPMLIARSGAATCVLDGFIYVIGGWHASTEYTNRVERFNVKCNRWEKVSSMNERRFRPGISVINGNIYVLGGEEGWDRYHDTIECYDPQKDEWNVTGKLLSSRSWLGCVPLKSNGVALLERMSKPRPDAQLHWICGSPMLAIDEKMKLNLNEFYKSGSNISDSGIESSESCFDDGRKTLEYEKKGPYPFRLYSPTENDAKCQAIDILFKDGVVSVDEIKLQNYYTAYLTVLMKLENYRGWKTMIDHKQLMPYPHFETESRSYFEFSPAPDQLWSNVTEMRFVLRQPSPNWRRFSVENLKIYKDTGRRCESQEAAAMAKNYLTGLIRKTTEALKMEHKNDKNSSTIPFHIGTYGYEIDKLIRF